MEITIGKAGVWTVISVIGEIDLSCSTDLRVQMFRHLDDGESVLLNMEEVSYIDSSGIAGMVQALTHARGLGVGFGLVKPAEAVMRILRLTRLDDIFEFYDSVQDAAGAS